MQILRVLGVAGILALTVAPAAQAQDLTPRILVGNPLIVVKGNTATSKVTFTEIRLDKADGVPQVVVQAREYATWEKVNGKWLYRKRNIFAGTRPPEWWKE